MIKTFKNIANIEISIRNSKSFFYHACVWANFFQGRLAGLTKIRGQKNYFYKTGFYYVK